MDAVWHMSGYRGLSRQFGNEFSESQTSHTLLDL
jgi:hypothetical protein